MINASMCLFWPLIYVFYFIHLSYSFLFKTLIWICFYPCDKFYLGLFWQCFTASPLWWWHIKKRVWIRVDTNSKYTLQSVSPLFGRSEACFIISIGLTHPDHLTWMNHERPISDHLLIEPTFISWDFPKVTARILKPRVQKMATPRNSVKIYLTNTSNLMRQLEQNFTRKVSNPIFSLEFY